MVISAVDELNLLKKCPLRYHTSYEFSLDLNPSYTYVYKCLYTHTYTHTQMGEIVKTNMFFIDTHLRTVQVFLSGKISLQVNREIICRWWNILMVPCGGFLQTITVVFPLSDSHLNSACVISTPNRQRSISLLIKRL